MQHRGCVGTCWLVYVPRSMGFLMSQSLQWRASVEHTVHDSLLPLQAIAEMAVLKVQSDKEQTMCEAEWKHLTQLLDTDRQQRVSARCATAAGCYHRRCIPRADYVKK